MAAPESSDVEEKDFLEGDNLACNGMTKKLDISNFSACSEFISNEDELKVDNNHHCLYLSNESASDNDCLVENKAHVKNFEGGEATSNCYSDTDKSFQSDECAIEITNNGADKTTASPVKTVPEHEEQQTIKSCETTSQYTETDMEETHFECYNHICPEIQAKAKIDSDFHTTAKKLFGSLNNEEEEEIEQKHPHNKLCQGEKLEWLDNQHQADTIHRLNVFRKSRKFCDLVLLVGGYEIYCHRVVVGGASRAIFDELCLGEQESGPISRIPIDASKPGLSAAAVEILIEYMYTSCLSFHCENLTAVYRAALQLGVERVIPICRRHVTAAVDNEQCIQMRRLAQNYGDTDMKCYMDGYIEDNFEAVSVTNEFLSLPRIKMEVIVSPNPSVANLLTLNVKDGSLTATALMWISNVIKGKGGTYLEDLTEQIQRIPLEDLTNAASSASNEMNKRRISQEAEHVRKTSEGSVGYIPRSRLTRSSSMDSLKSSDSNDSLFRVKCDPEGEWKVIASLQVKDTEHIIALCCLGDVLCALSIRIPSVSSPNGENTNGHDIGYNIIHHLSSVSSSSASCCSSVGSNFHFCPMNQPRSAVGVAQIDGKIIAAGGFHQSESLDTVECFDVSSNRWSGLSRMNDKRGRFSVAVLNGQLYAVGGSTGSHDLSSVERYDPIQDAWSQVQSLPFSCSATGVAVLNGLLYCVGGVRQSIGIAGLRTCFSYNPFCNKWEHRASLHTARSSLGVAALGDYLYAVAGSDGWKCLSSAEKYDPSTNLWTFTASLNINRRGLGLTEHNGSLYCVGGSDGQSFLSSVERYNPGESEMWTLTSWALAVPRNCAGVTSANGTVFVVGGFSGRQFLASVEAVEDSATEWLNHDSASSKGASSDAKDSD